jgi:hypothetical protein
MSTYLVGFDLDTPGQNYRGISQRLKDLGTWWHNLDSTWLVKSDMTVVQLRDYLRPLMDTTDKVFVVDVTARAAAWSGFSEQASAWIKEWM